MAVTAKKLAQTALSTSVVARYTVPTATKAYVSEIFLANSGSSERTVSIYAHGTAATNLLMTIIVSANGGVIIEDKKIVLAASEVLAAKQDAGTDITFTVYGIEEA